jgi:hypothetical protein
LLFGQFTRARSLALLALACGYPFDALIIIPHALTFPASLRRKGCLGPDRKRQPDYCFWHGGFASHGFVLFLQGHFIDGRTFDRPCVGQGAGHNRRARVS